MEADAVNLRDVIVFLVVAGLIVPMIQRLGLGPILAFLLAGIVIGPFGLARLVDDLPWIAHGVIADLEGVRALAELGIVFLLFTIGLELSLKRLWAMRHSVLGLGGGQVLLTGAVIAIIAAWFGNDLPAALVLGAGFALSSTAIVMPTLARNRRLGTRTGQICFAILLFQDIAVLPMLFMVEVFATRSSGSIWVALLIAFAQAALAVGAILIVGRMIIRPVFRFIGKTANRERFLAAVLLMIIGTAMATAHAGLSMALGAFLAGLLFAETEYRHEIEVDIEPFKGLLLGLFFVSVGMGIDPAQIAANPAWIAASIAGLFLIKGLIIYGLARLMRRARAVSLETAILLGQGGEFAFLIVGLSRQAELIGPDVAQFMLIVSGLTMVATPVAAHAARRLARRWEMREATGDVQETAAREGLSSHVIIAGYGRVGQVIGSLLEQQGIVHLGIDKNRDLTAEFREQDANILLGDASRPEILRMAGIDRASAFVTTIDDPDAAGAMVAIVHRHWPHLQIYARARDLEHARWLRTHGAHHVVLETIEASLQLSELVLMDAGVPDEAARRVVDLCRERQTMSPAD